MLYYCKIINNKLSSLSRHYWNNHWSTVTLYLYPYYDIDNPEQFKYTFETRQEIYKNKRWTKTPHAAALRLEQVYNNCIIMKWWWWGWIGVGRWSNDCLQRQFVKTIVEIIKTEFCSTTCHTSVLKYDVCHPCSLVVGLMVSKKVVSTQSHGTKADWRQA